MIRREKAEFLDSVLKLFEDHKPIRKKELEEKFKDDFYAYRQTEIHLAILERDGMISHNVLDEYYLQPKGCTVLNDIDRLGYLANHNKTDSELKDENENLSPVNVIFIVIELLVAIFVFAGL